MLITPPPLHVNSLPLQDGGCCRGVHRVGGDRGVRGVHRAGGDRGVRSVHRAGVTWGVRGVHRAKGSRGGAKNFPEEKQFFSPKFPFSNIFYWR